MDFTRKYGQGNGKPRSRKRCQAAIDALTLAAHRVDHKTITACMRDMRKLSKDKDSDPRTRKMALDFLVSHGWAVYEHEHPATTKIEHSGTVSMPTIIQPVLHGVGAVVMAQNKTKIKTKPKDPNEGE